MVKDIDDKVDREIEKAEVDLDKEERLERIRRKALKWDTWHFCRSMVVDMLDGMVDMIIIVSQSAMEGSSPGVGPRSGWKSSQG